MKKSISAGIVLWMLGILIACAQPVSMPSGKLSRDDMGLKIGQTVHYLREDSQPARDTLGEPVDYSEIISCVYEGMSKTFIYQGLEINTAPVSGKDIIETFILTDATYETLRGIRVGDDLEQLTAVYGEEYFNDGYYTYSMTNDPADIRAERIQFEVKDEKIAKIYIYSPSY